MSEEKRNAVAIDLSEMEEVQPIPRLNLHELAETKCYQLPNDGPYMVFECEPSFRYKGGCPRCGSAIFSVHGKMKEPRLVHDVSVGLKQIDLLISVPRYRCEACGHTFNYRFDCVLENRQMTYRLYDHIRREAFVRPFDDIANEYGYTNTTIATIFDEYVAELEKNRDAIVAPRVLGIDEKHIVRNMRGVFVDIESGALLEMTPANKKSDVMATIENMVDYDKNIEIVTMDMANGYRSHVRECLPHARIVVDKYHVIQDLNTKVTSTKTKIIKNLTQEIENMPETPEKKHLKDVLKIAAKDHYLFRYGHDKLNDMPQRRKDLADVCRTFAAFNHLRLLKEGFEMIYDCEDRKKAEDAFAYWTQFVPPKIESQMNKWCSQYEVDADLFSDFRALQNTVNNWHDEIFNYFEPGCNVTNAAAEGLNNMIERINRSGNGYSFERLRAKALYWHIAAPRNRFVLRTKQEPIYKKKAISRNHSESLDHSFSRLVTPYIPMEREIVGYKEYTEVYEDESIPNRFPLSVFMYLPDDHPQRNW